MRNKILLLIALCFITYYNSLFGQFVSDDINAILNNPNISHINFLNPQSIVYGVLHHFFKFNVIPYHVANVTLHALNTVLVFLLLLRLFPQMPALIGACVFAVNPIHCEAVSWISGSSHIYMALGFLLVLLLYRKHMWVALIIYVYFMYSFYSFLASLCLLLFLIDWKKSLLFIVVSAYRIYTLLPTIHTRQLSVASINVHNSFYGHPVFVVAHAIVGNLKMLFFPFRLMLYHEPEAIAHPYCEVAFVILLLSSLWYIYKKSQPIFFGIVVFLIYLIPVMLPKPVCWLIAERYLYTSSMMISILSAIAYEHIPRNLNDVKFVILFYIFLIFTIRTIDRNTDWHTPERFWRAEIMTNPNNARNHNNMGQVYVNELNINFAHEEFRKSLEIDPEQKESWYNIAQCLKFEGKTKESDYAFRRSEMYARNK